MPKLSDIQSILLTAAVGRDNGSLLPPAPSIAEAGDRLTKALAALLNRGLVEEGPAPNRDTIYRTDGDDRFALFITAAGREAIGAGEDGGGAGQSAQASAPEPAKPPRQTKSAAVIALMKREHGATLAELVDATGWLPHTTRAALTGFKKKGHVIDKSKRDEVTCYRIVASA